MSCCYCVPNDEVWIKETCGKFSGTAQPGFLCVPIPCICTISGRVSNRIRQLNVPTNTKTKDNVFVDVTVNVQYVVQLDRVFDAHYRLQDAERQITSYVYDVVRGTVPTQNLDEVFESKEEIAKAVKEELRKSMDEFGWTIVTTLVTDVDPDRRVRDAMNEINASRRQRKATEEKAEADKILIVKRAEADAESKFLQGAGIARQRRAIIDGLKDSVHDFSSNISGMSTKDVLDLVLITQYFDTVRELGHNSAHQTLYLPHNPGSLSTLAEEIRAGVVERKSA